MKLLTSFSHAFPSGYTYINSIYEAAKNLPGLSGLYLAHPDYLELARIGTTNTLKVKTWYNLIYDTNYLEGSGSDAACPSLVLNDSQFNYQPSIDFADTGNQYLTFKVGMNVGTIIIVYLTRVSGSYLIFAPRSLPGNPPLLWDAFPPGATGLWRPEPLSGNSIYDADSRINSRAVLSNVFIPLNNPRILSVTNISNVAEAESVSGFGGSNVTPNLSVRGKIAAIITTSAPATPAQLLPVESALATTYIGYNGTTISSTPSFRVFVNTTFTFDFATIAVDEWFDIVSYTLISPGTLGLSFTGSVLSGIPTIVYKGSITISITNSNSMTNQFTFPFETVKADPLTVSLPNQSTLSVVLSAFKDLDLFPYGVYTNPSTQVINWEDARRIIPSVTTPNYIASAPSTGITYDSSTNKVVFDNAVPTSLAGSSFSLKTLVWVYKQTQSGTRNMANNFPDIYGTGVLWTVNDPSFEIFGTTPITQLQTKVNRVSVNAFNYRLPLNSHVIVTATAISTGVGFSGFSTALKGDLEFFCGWTTILTENQLNTIVALLADRYFPLQLLVFDTSTEFRYVTAIEVDLKRKVTHLDSTELVEYEILVNHYSAVVSPTGILSFTAVNDDFVTFTIRAFTTAESVTFSFSVNITLLTNPLYINLKQYFGVFSGFYIVTPDTATISAGNITNLDEYRSNGQFMTGNNSVTYTQLQAISNYPAAGFNIDGSSFLQLASPANLTGYTFIIAYIRKAGSTGYAFLFGQDSYNAFNSGVNGALLDSPWYGDLHANGQVQDNTYVLPEEILSVIIFNSTDEQVINTVAKDRMFTDRSVKGYVPFFCVIPTLMNPSDFTLIEKYIRDYYQGVKTITLMNFDPLVTDNSTLGKIVSSNLVSGYTVKKRFGSASFPIALNSDTSYVIVPNETDFAFLGGDFTIAGWLLLNSDIGTDQLNVYSQSGLNIYVSGTRLYLGRTNFIGLALFSQVLTLDADLFYNFAVTRKDGVLRMYYNGTKVFQMDDTYEYRDYNSDILIGQSTSIATGGVNLLLDSFTVQSRNALYTGNTYTIPVSAYQNL